MRASIALLLVACQFISASPAVAVTSDTSRRQVNVLEDALLLDSVAFTSGSSTSKTANFRINTFVRQPDIELGSILNDTIIPQLLELVPGLDVVGDSLATFLSRIKPFLAIPVGDEEVELHVPECKGGQGIDLGKTEKVAGFLERNADLGECAFGDDNVAEGIIEASSLPGLKVEDVKNKIFFSPAEGWSVISGMVYHSRTYQCYPINALR